MAQYARKWGPQREREGWQAAAMPRGFGQHNSRRIAAARGRPAKPPKEPGIREPAVLLRSERPLNERHLLFPASPITYKLQGENIQWSTQVHSWMVCGMDEAALKVIRVSVVKFSFTPSRKQILITLSCTKKKAQPFCNFQVTMIFLEFPSSLLGIHNII